MDLTSIFRSSLDRVKKKNQHSPAIQSTSQSDGMKKSSIFPQRKSEYYNQASDLRRKITKLRDFLTDTKTAYLNIGNGLLRSWKRDGDDLDGNFSSLTDLERDKVDEDVQKIVQACQQQIFEFERIIQSSDAMAAYPQLKLHLDNVQNSLVYYLKEVCEIHSEMRAIRVKRTVNYKNMSKIAHPVSFETPAASKRDRASSRHVKVNSNFHRDIDEPDNVSKSPGSIEDQLSPEELQMYEEENEQLLNELNTLSEEVNQIETSVVKIAQLQEIFTEKVLQQDKDVNKITDLVVGATENVRDGNEQIRQSIQKNADFRAWVLFFIIVMSFSLLFLDWYND